MNILRLIRLKHWVKNLFVLTPLIFSRNLFNPQLARQSGLAFAVFCLISSATYIINDIIDRENDREHPVKQNRPLASGRVSLKTAVCCALLLGTAGVFLGLLLPWSVLLIMALYVAVTLLYSCGLKNFVLIDVLLIAFGFVLRVAAGGAALGVELSSWLLLSTFFISLFLGFGKRRNDLTSSMSNKEKHRPVLRDYNIQLLDYMIIISVTLTVTTYSLYAVDPETIKRFGTDKLIYSLPFVVYGLFKYLHILYKKQELGDPADIVTKDKSIIITVLLWGIFVSGLLYFRDIQF